MKISEVSKLTGLSYDTIRYYEKLNFIQSELKNHRREYSEEHIALLNSIQLLKQAAFSLKEIHYFIKLDNQFKTMEEILNMSDSEYRHLKETIKEKKQHVENLIENLNTAKVLLTSMEVKIDSLEREK